ncbi:MAG TPA: sigma-70 family RNA polymerase sigma factor [Armatimonadota bacterium]|nr:sigma-70 family RNA polymerase sigma factor [Armatimonadota bacterium]
MRVAVAETEVELMGWQQSVAKAQRGDAKAFGAVVGRFQDMAVGYAYSILGDFHLAEDAAQDAFVQAYLNLSALREVRAFPSWLRRIVFKQCNRITRRKRVATVPLEAGVESADPRWGPHEAVEQRETQREVLFAVNALPDKERTAATLFYIDGYSMGEVGDFLGVPVSTIKNRLHSARTQLRERMEAEVRETLSSHRPDDQFGKRVKRVLAGVERIHWTTTSCICFAGAAAACMHYLREDVSNDYVMGISGGAFKMIWEPPWGPRNCDLLMLGAEPVKRTFAALGYDYTFVPDYDRENPGAAKDVYRKAIVESIDKGLPVIAIGVVGPPEACIVAGYDKRGEVLYGRSYFQESNKGYFSEADWFENCHGLILLGEKGEPPSRRQVLRDTLEWAIRLARELELPLATIDGKVEKQLISGLAAYDAMAEALERDEDFAFADDDLETMEMRCFAIANDGLHLLYPKRRDAASFLTGMAEDGEAASDELRQAVEAYEDEMTVLGPAYDLAPNSFATQQKRLALRGRDLRRKLSALVREAKVHDERAVGHLEQALASLR